MIKGFAKELHRTPLALAGVTHDKGNFMRGYRGTTYHVSHYMENSFVCSGLQGTHVFLFGLHGNKICSSGLHKKGLSCVGYLGNRLLVFERTCGKSYIVGVYRLNNTLG